MLKIALHLDCKFRLKPHSGDQKQLLKEFFLLLILFQRLYRLLCTHLGYPFLDLLVLVRKFFLLLLV